MRPFALLLSFTALVGSAAAEPAIGETGGEARGFASVSIAFSHSCARTEDGALYCWGWGRHGKVGDGTDVNRQRAVRVEAPTRWRDVAVGSQHTCGIRSDGTLHCWGWNEKGRLGLGYPMTEVSRPTLLGLGDRWATISAGAQHTCGIQEGGRLYCWGANSRGQVGDGSPWTPSWSLFDRPALGFGSLADQWTPAAIGEASDWTKVSAGLEHTCALRESGQLYCWGGTLRDPIGSGHRQPERFGTDTWRDISVGHLHACGVKQDGTLWCWGWNLGGQLGDGTTRKRDRPFSVDDATDWDSVRASAQHTCARKRDGRLFCWGRNKHGRLGDGTDRDRRTPVEISPGSTWRDFDVAPEHTCGVRHDGDLFCWGFWGDGRLGTGGDRVEEWAPKPVLVEDP